VLDGAGQDVGDGFNAAVGMPGKASEVFVRVVVAEVVEEQERVEFFRVAESEAAAQMDARAFERRTRLDDSFDGPDRHFLSIYSRAMEKTSLARLSLVAEIGRAHV